MAPPFAPWNPARPGGRTPEHRPARPRGALLVGAWLALALLLAAGPGAAHAVAYELIFSTGPEGSIEHAIGRVLEARSAELPADQVKLRLAPSLGSIQNLNRLVAGEAHVAIVQGDVLFNAYKGRREFARPLGKLRALAVLYPETIHVVARKQAGIARLEDLRGKRVVLGAEGSGAASTARMLLESHGVEPRSVEVWHLSVEETLSRFRLGAIDAFFHVGAAPAKPVTEALEAGGVLVRISEERTHGLLFKSPYLALRSIPKAAYGLERDIPAVTVDAVLIAREDVDGNDAYQLLRLLFNARDKLAAIHPRAGEFTASSAAEGIKVPLHPGAMTYYENQKVLEFPVRVYTSIYLVDVIDLDLKRGTYHLDFNIWFRWKGLLTAENESFQFEIMNGKVASRQPPVIEKYGGWNYAYYRVFATMHGNFPLHKYPFDTQTIKIEVEHTTMAMDQLVFVPDDLTVDGKPRDMLRTAVTPGLSIADWVITGIRQSAVPFVYPTDFGSMLEKGPEPTRWSRYCFEVDLRRVVFPYLLKFTVPLVVIVLMSFLSFFIRPEEFQVQSGIVVTALLSSVAFHLTQSSNLPDVGYLVTADKFFILTYVVIFLALAEACYANRVLRGGKLERALQIQRICRFAFPIAYFAMLGVIIATGLGR